MKKWIIGSVVCALLALASIWAGAWLMYEYPSGTWQNFPVVATTFSVCSAFILGACACVAMAMDIHREAEWKRIGGAK